MAETQAPQRNAFEIVASIAPAATIGAVVAALAFTMGYLSPFGHEWISLLTVKDLFARSWAMLPPVLVLICFNALVTTPPGEKFSKAFDYIADIDAKIDAHFGKAREKSRTEKAIGFAITAGSFFIFAASGVLIFSIQIDKLKEFYFPVVSLLVGANMFSASVITLRLFDTRSSVPKHWALMGYVAILLTFAAGIGLGSSAYLTQMNTLVRYSTHSYCGKYIMSAERGLLLYNPNLRAVRLIPWSDIKLVDRPVQCRLQPKWKPPLKSTGGKAGSTKGG